MKALTLLLVACVCFCSVGCASLIADSGKKLSDFKTREEVDTYFGKPRTTEETDGEVKVTYITRKKIADPWGASMAFSATLFTLGLAEPFFLLGHTGGVVYHTIGGKEITFTFDKQGRIIEYTPWECYWSSPRVGYLRDRAREEEEQEQRERNAASDIIIPPLIEIPNTAP